MIEFDNLSFTYPGEAQPALRNVSMQLMQGAFTLVTGNSGCGKSTLLRCINGLVPHFSGGHISGSVRVLGADPILCSPQGMSQTVGMVLQDPESQFVMDVVEDEIAFALENAGLARAEMRMRVEEALDLLGLASLRTRTVVGLSGGEKQRVAIASALALRPRVLVLDEPTSQLDPASAEDVLNAITRLNSDLGLTIVLSEHRLDRVLQYADLLVLMERGTARIGQPAAMVGLLPHPPPVVVVGTALGWTPLPITVKQGRMFSSTIPSNSGILTQPQNKIPDRKTSANLELRDIAAFHGSTKVVNQVTFGVAAGEIVALMGRNGSGKSTLLRTVVGLHKSASGIIRLSGTNIVPLGVAARCMQIGYLPQDPNAMLFAETVEAEVIATLKNHKTPVAERAAKTATILKMLHIDHLANAYPRDLSTGERQRVALAAILVTNPRILLLDEPTRGLDGGAKHNLGNLLRERRANGIGILVVTHDVEFAAELADRIVIVAQGEVIADGVPVDVLSKSPVFSTQVAKLFPNSGWLTPEQIQT